MSWGGKISGTGALSTKFADMKALAGDDVALRALEAAGEPIADAARGNVRARTGRLRESIGVGTQLSPHQAAITPSDGKPNVYVGPGALPEAITEEFGTFDETPHPFLRPAWDSAQSAALDKATESYAAECGRIAEA